jgi:hypothetical protein
LLIQAAANEWRAIKACPVNGGKVKSFDASKITGSNGVKKVVKVEDYAVAVIADSWWQAKTALDTFPIVWDEGENCPRPITIDNGRTRRTPLRAGPACPSPLSLISITLSRASICTGKSYRADKCRHMAHALRRRGHDLLRGAAYILRRAGSVGCP